MSNESKLVTGIELDSKEGRESLARSRAEAQEILKCDHFMAFSIKNEGIEIKMEIASSMSAKLIALSISHILELRKDVAEDLFGMFYEAPTMNKEDG